MSSVGSSGDVERGSPGTGTTWLGWTTRVLWKRLSSTTNWLCRLRATSLCSFVRRTLMGRWIDYETAVSGELQLVPEGPAYEALADDYGRMLSDGMLLDDEERFEALMERCADIEERCNRVP